ncbi:hypothetical protein [Rhodococcus opacus]|uniref:Uncharacterized protein n=1 Tax=Rhodococcus opacus (strain B4) TaxID=632772 RepID=C1B9B5_RHOOB|nr:hypothetical protein [Rhodococcus opacus]BAH52268.1 hypothetical protein ROP_40210 [Rhodococcus opacus B4]
MNSWEAMTYDEQRALLGLPDVRWYVATQSLKRGMTEIKAAFERVAEAIAPAVRAFNEAVEGLEIK